VVLGELDHASTQRYLQFLTHARKKSATHHAVVFKAHPLVDATTFDLRPLNASASTDHVSDLLRRARVLITGASGSTVLEALSRGIPTICVLDPAELDLSTIHEHPLLKVVGTVDEFESALVDLLSSTTARATTDRSLFHVDADLKRWRRLLLEPNA
jgi:surface carbohydrate biosynthesis protein (TIGR04326 family)